MSCKKGNILVLYFNFGAASLGKGGHLDQSRSGGGAKR